MPLVPGAELHLRTALTCLVRAPFTNCLLAGNQGRERVLCWLSMFLSCCATSRDWEAAADMAEKIYWCRSARLITSQTHPVCLMSKTYDNLSSRHLNLFVLCFQDPYSCWRWRETLRRALTRTWLRARGLVVAGHDSEPIVGAIITQRAQVLRKHRHLSKFVLNHQCRCFTVNRSFLHNQWREI